MNTDNQNNTGEVSQNTIVRILRDNSWQGVGVIVAIIAIIVPGIFYFLQESTPELTIVREQPESLIQVQSETGGSIEIRYNGRIIDNATLIRFHIENTGNQSIEESDYNRNISFEFDPNVEIIDYAVTEERPSNIGMVLTQTAKHKIEVIPTLLNVGDTATLRIIAISNTNQEESSHFKVDARIKDIPQVKETISAERGTGLILLMYSMLVITLASIFVTIALYGFLQNEPIRTNRAIRSAISHTMAKIVRVLVAHKIPLHTKTQLHADINDIIKEGADNNSLGDMIEQEVMNEKYYESN